MNGFYRLLSDFIDLFLDSKPLSSCSDRSIGEPGIYNDCEDVALIV